MNPKRSGKEAFTFVDPVTKTEVLQLTNCMAERSVHGYYDLPPWDRVTGRIVFSSLEPYAREGDIYVMNRDGGNITYLAHSNAMSSNGGATCQWAIDGSRVYFRDREGDQPLTSWVDMKTGRKESVPGGLRMICPTAHLNVYSVAAGYPDEELVSRRDELGVYVQDLQTGESHQVVSVGDCWRAHPRRDEIAEWHVRITHTKWSPDGTQIMLVFTNEISYDVKYDELPRVKDIYIVNADGTGLKRVGEFGHHPLWHPNGRQILANSRHPERTQLGLVLYDVETGEQTLATKRVAGSGHPSYSPDGTKIAIEFVQGGEGSASIDIVDVPADTTRHVLSLRVRDHSHVGTHLHPVWSHDSAQLLYASDASGVAQLCVINV